MVWSNTGFLEGAWFIASVNVSPLSEQQLVDCDLVDSTGNLSGCQLGIPQGGVVDYTDVVYRQRADNDVGNDTATGVHRH